MITISKTENSFNDYILAELRGLSTDDKPTAIDELKIANGSTFIEIDTGKIYFYDLENELWKEV